MAKIKKVVKVELTNEEKLILCKTIKILDDLADKDGADELFEIVDNYAEKFYYLSCALDKLVENSD